MQVITNIVYLLGAIILVSFFVLASDMPYILLQYKYPVVGIYLILLVATEVVRRRRSQRR